jgi:hypothetical protein
MYLLYLPEFWIRDILRRVRILGSVHLITDSDLYPDLNPAIFAIFSRICIKVMRIRTRILLVTLMRIWILRTFHFVTDPGPSFQIKDQLKNCSNSASIHFGLSSTN